MLSLRCRGGALRHECSPGFRPFLDELVGSDLPPQTIQKHVDNLWALGGEIIRDLNETPFSKKEKH